MALALAQDIFSIGIFNNKYFLGLKEQFLAVPIQLCLALVMPAKTWSSSSGAVAVGDGGWAAAAAGPGSSGWFTESGPPVPPDDDGDDSNAVTTAAGWL